MLLPQPRQPQLVPPITIGSMHSTQRRENRKLSPPESEPWNPHSTPHWKTSGPPCSWIMGWSTLPSGRMVCRLIITAGSSHTIPHHCNQRVLLTSHRSLHF